MHLYHRGGGAAGFLWLETESRFRGIKGGNAAGWGVEAAVGRGEQRGIGGWSCAAVICGLDWCGGDASGLILQVWHFRQLQSLEGCSSLAAQTGVGSREWCCGCAADMNMDTREEFQLRGRSRPRCAAWVFRAAAAVLRCEGAGGGLRPEFCVSVPCRMRDRGTLEASAAWICFALVPPSQRSARFLALPHSGWPTFLELTCWVRGTNP